MPTHEELTEEELEDMTEGGGLKKRTLEDRKRDADAFFKFFDKKAGGRNMPELAENEDGRKLITQILAEYFFSMRVEGGKRPKRSYAEKMKTSIKMTGIAQFQINVFNPEMFPEVDKKWRAFIEKLTEEGRAEIVHKEEIPGQSLDSIYEMLWNAKDAIETRGSEEYGNKLAKVPPSYHDKLNRIMQMGAQLILTLYDVRRDCENLDELKASDLEVIEDETFEFKYIRERNLYEPNMKVGARMIAGMMQSLCEAAGVPRCTNHAIRCTAIKFMRRAGIPWLTIAKVTGHKSVESLIKHYDLNIEAPGLADIASALAQGPAVARGEKLQEVQLKARKKESPITIEFGDKVEESILIEDDSEEIIIKDEPLGGKKRTSTDMDGDANFNLDLHVPPPSKIVKPPSTSTFPVSLPTHPSPPGKPYPSITPGKKSPTPCVNPAALQGYPPSPYGYPQPLHGYSPAVHDYPPTPQNNPYAPHSYPPAPQGYPPAPHGYPPTPQGYPPAPHGCPLAPHSYPPAPHGYPPAPHGYPTAPYGYPPAPHAYPPAPHGYPPVTHSYPPAPQGYPPAPHGYPPTPHGYPAACHGNPPIPHTYPPAHYPYQKSRQEKFMRVSAPSNVTECSSVYEIE